MTRPKLLIADEPTTALDVTVQAQILGLLRDLQQETGMAIIFISHDLGVVAGLANQVVVMYSGRVMETGSVDDIFYRRHHPYTTARSKSTPRLDRIQDRLPTIAGMPPDPTRQPKGCPFAGRCEHKMEICDQFFPSAKTLSGMHDSFCHLDLLYAGEDTIMAQNQFVAEVKNLSVRYKTGTGFFGGSTQYVHAVNDVSLEIATRRSSRSRR
jgi:oligopeptide transport system ATP-binding protein